MGLLSNQFCHPILDMGSIHLYNEFMHLPMIIFLITGLLASFVAFKTLLPSNKPISPVVNQKTEQSKPNIFEDQVLGFSLQMPEGYDLVTETEEEFFERNKTDYRKNFKYYVTYEPPVVTKILTLKGHSENLASLWDSAHFSLWVFDNPENITIEAWYDNYWYYPFLWGQFNAPEKQKIAPTKEGVIIDYQPGKPKFVYMQSKDKMFLMRILGEDGEKIFNSLKLK